MANCAVLKLTAETTPNDLYTYLVTPTEDEHAVRSLRGALARQNRSQLKASRPYTAHPKLRDSEQQNQQNQQNQENQQNQQQQQQQQQHRHRADRPSSSRHPHPHSHRHHHRNNHTQKQHRHQHHPKQHYVHNQHYNQHQYPNQHQHQHKHPLHHRNIDPTGMIRESAYGNQRSKNYPSYSPPGIQLQTQQTYLGSSHLRRPPNHTQHSVTHQNRHNRNKHVQRHRHRPLLSASGVPVTVDGDNNANTNSPSAVNQTNQSDTTLSPYNDSLMSDTDSIISTATQIHVRRSQHQYHGDGKSVPPPYGTKRIHHGKRNRHHTSSHSHGKYSSSIIDNSNNSSNTHQQRGYMTANYPMRSNKRHLRKVSNTSSGSSRHRRLGSAGTESFRSDIVELDEIELRSQHDMSLKQHARRYRTPYSKKSAHQYTTSFEDTDRAAIAAGIGWKTKHIVLLHHVDKANERTQSAITEVFGYVFYFYFLFKPSLTTSIY